MQPALATDLDTGTRIRATGWPLRHACHGDTGATADIAATQSLVLRGLHRVRVLTEP